MAGDPQHDRRRLASWYERFAAEEAHGESAIYERLARGVAASPALLDFLLTLPRQRRQPNLFLAAVRRLHGVPEDLGRLVEIVAADGRRVRALMLVRTTQTNEPGRCAVLLPLLARLPQPLALIEIGAAAGLCLLPDRYGYDYGAAKIAAPANRNGPAPVLRCRVNGDVPVPTAVPHIVWRRGLDLDPIDLGSEEDVAWLETLVWPGQDERARRLQRAIAMARAAPPQIFKGDLLTDLEPLIAAAPADATLVVYHSAVLAYVGPQENRERFAEQMRDTPAVWISNEAANVFPALAAAAAAPPRPGLFLLMQDGVPVAWAAPHGQSLDWIDRR
jgi:hypothetical protein